MHLAITRYQNIILLKYGIVLTKLLGMKNMLTNSNLLVQYYIVETRAVA